jgi:hypothetical protein
MYHATRVLASEAASIKNEGLLLQTPALRAAKLGRLVAEGLATREEVTLWEANGPVFWPGHEARHNEVCLVAPVQIFTEFRDGFVSLFGDWGGESLSWAAAQPGREGADPTRDQIRAILNRINGSSRPAVIEVAVKPDDLPGLPRLWQLMVGRLIGARDASNEWHLRIPVPSVLDIIQPGHPRWKSSWLRKTG